MSRPQPELLILVITLVAIALAPLASRLVARVGAQISSELDGGRSGESLQAHLDGSYEGAPQDDEIAQMVAARDFLRGERARDAQERIPREDAELREEVRQLVVASNERRLRAGQEPLDVDAEVVRRVARLLGTNGHAR